jgi:predicted alpha-1,2-mannosidase
MMQSLVDAATQEGWLPKWPLANGYTDAMNGDSADPMIASAFAFGARSFDAATALTQMVKGATAVDGVPGQGWYIARPDLDEYLKNGYVSNTHANSLSPLPNAGSETLEYSLDDFAISRLASAVGDNAASTRFAVRSGNWENLFDVDTGLIAPRDADGAFFESPMNRNGQSGFQEGNSVQYSWLVPQDLRDLFDAMGGDARVAQRLDDFFTNLDAGPGEPYAWLGNEPSILQPWLYLSVDQPWKTQALVRRIETSLYTDTPAGEAGNDDLGTMSAWYVWSAMGLYPQTPGVPLLDIGSPLFTHVAIATEDGRSISIDAPAAADDAPYVQAMRIDGGAYDKSWIDAPITGALAIHYDLGASPIPAWASAPGDGPPSWGAGRLHLPPTTTVTLTVTPSAVQLISGSSTTLTVAATNPADGRPARVRWQTSSPGAPTSAGEQPGIDPPSRCPPVQVSSPGFTMCRSRASPTTARPSMARPQRFKCASPAMSRRSRT